MNKIIAAIIGLIVLAVPVLACEGPGCDPYDKELSVNTFFTNDGPISAFQEFTSINSGKQWINEVAFAFGGELTVGSYEEFAWNGCRGTEMLNADKQIYWDSQQDEGPNFVTIGKDVVWNDGSGDVYVALQDPWGESKQIHAGGIGDGAFANRIWTDESIQVYQSVGLNEFATCGPVTPPTPLPFPHCEWCIE